MKRKLLWFAILWLVSQVAISSEAWELVKKDSDHDIKIYQCICCKTYMMPPMDYYTSTEEDKELYNIIAEALNGKIVEKAVRHRVKPIHSGTVAFVGGENNPDNDGKFIPLE